jgi:hypothetical protein
LKGELLRKGSEVIFVEESVDVGDENGVEIKEDNAVVLGELEGSDLGSVD